MTEMPDRAEEARLGTMELLSPAGDMPSLIAAVEAGADAVYLGGKAFSARRNAANFDAEALVRAADYCHERGRRVYVTVNTLVKNQELAQLSELAGQIARAGADAVIVQDLGVCFALREMIPDLALHASTQMAVHNRQGVDFLRENGFSRVVLAREMDFREIADCAGRGVELEVFAHGALCVSCSGQCLMSSLIGGRSGNRGLCAQPCRLSYALEGPAARDAGALLSTRDLRQLENIARLWDAGVTSLKVEGRLKGPEYVGAVTAAYRRALDALQAGEPPALEPLDGVFNRGYTRGYGPGLVDGELIEDQTEKHVVGRAGAAVISRPIPVTACLTVKIDHPLALRVGDGRDEAIALGEAVQPARLRPADGARLVEQVKKTGGTPYAIDQVDLVMDEAAFVPVSAVNLLRRRALSDLGAARAARRRGCAAQVLPLPQIPVARPAPAKPLLAVASRDEALLEKARAWGADEVIYEIADATRGGEGGAPDGRFTLRLPPVLNGDCLAALHAWALANGRIDGVLLSNPAHLSLAWPCPVRLDAPMNIMNDFAVARFGLPYAPSVELTAKEIAGMGGEKELLVYGRLTLMRLAHCPVRARIGGRHADCRLCDTSPASGLEAHALTDRKGRRFPMRRLKTGAGCLVEIDNCVPLFLLRNAGRIPPAARWRVRLTDEGALGEDIVRLHRAALDGEDYKSLPAWGAADALATTTGHYFRGVE